MNRVQVLVLLMAAGSAMAQPAPTSQPADAAKKLEPKTTPAAVQSIAPVKVSDRRSSGLAVAIEQVLDTKIDFDIDDQNILVAFAELTKRTGIRFVIDQDVLDRLPYGEQTKLKAKIRDATLRESLKGLLSPIGLAYEVRENEVGILATAPLRRIVRRATWDELDTLRRLSDTPWSEEVLKSLNIQYQDAGMEDQVSGQTLHAAAARVGAGTALDVLNVACNQLGWTWFPWNDRVVVLSKRRQLERQLGKKITAKFFRVPISDVLLDLGREAGVLVKLDPGAISSLPPHLAQTFTLTVENSSLRQAFEVVSGTTGLGFSIDQDGVRFSASQMRPESLASGGGDSAAAAALAMRSNSVLGMITVKGENGAPDVSFFFRDSDLPPDLKELHKKKLEEAVNAMRKAYGATKDTGVE